MRAAYQLSCRKRPGKDRHEFGVSMDDARFRRRWSVAWSPSDHKVDSDFKGFVTPLMTVETRRTLLACSEVCWRPLVDLFRQFHGHFLISFSWFTLRCCTQDTALRYGFDAFQKALMMIPHP